MKLEHQHQQHEAGTTSHQTTRSWNNNINGNRMRQEHQQQQQQQQQQLWALRQTVHPDLTGSVQG
jgi:hypothetical protein